MLLDKAANEDFRGGPGLKKVTPRNSEVKNALLEQCEAMSIYALESGTPVPVDSLNVVEEALNEPDSIKRYIYDDIWNRVKQCFEAFERFASRDTCGTDAESAKVLPFGCQNLKECSYAG